MIQARPEIPSFFQNLALIRINDKYPVANLNIARSSAIIAVQQKMHEVFYVRITRDTSAARIRENV